MILVGFSRIPIFGLRVITENNIFMSGAATNGNMFFYDHEWDPGVACVVDAAVNSTTGLKPQNTNHLSAITSD